MAGPQGCVVLPLPGDRSSKGIKRDILGPKRGFPWHRHLLHMDHHSLVLREIEVSKGRTTKIRLGGESGAAEVAALKSLSLSSPGGKERIGARSDRTKRGLLGAVKYAWVNDHLLSHRHVKKSANQSQIGGLGTQTFAVRSVFSLRLPLHVIRGCFV